MAAAVEKGRQPCVEEEGEGEEGGIVGVVGGPLLSLKGFALPLTKPGKHTIKPSNSKQFMESIQEGIDAVPATNLTAPFFPFLHSPGRLDCCTLTCHCRYTPLARTSG